ncbi:MAG: alpha/beta hydrolase [Bacteroidaceae bacterium]|nr:alpha/beta hydrolase [Bacteroidaceae bacterium]
MRKILVLLVLSVIGLNAKAQIDAGQHGFGGQQKAIELPCSEKFLDVNYADDGQAFHTLDIYLPKQVKEKYPVVVHIYGSAWFSNNSKGMADLGTIVNALLNAGYAVVCPNHRSSMDAKWPAQINDIKAVVRFVRGEAAKYHFDTDFIATSGFSSGGHLSSFMAATCGMKTGKVGKAEIDIEGNLGKYTNESSLINAAVSWSGPICLEAMNCSGAYPDKDKSPEAALIGKPCTDETLDMYLTVSSSSFIDANDPPLLGFHGTADFVVPYCQAQEWDKLYTAAGAKHEFVTVPDGNHGFNGMYDQPHLDKMVQFLDGVKGGK